VLRLTAVQTEWGRAAHGDSLRAFVRHEARWWNSTFTGEQQHTRWERSCALIDPCQLEVLHQDAEIVEPELLVVEEYGRLGLVGS